jgi:3alpha(or 20beta)-hydroxysteroid dehydrogenase
MERLSGKIALVSGGSRGMGAAHARAIVANDGKVVIGDILEAEGAALARELDDAARFIRLDVTKADDWKAAVTLAVTEFGGLNVLVNNAGIVTFATLDMTEAQWNTVVGINLTGVFLGIKAAVAALKASAPASIINISSISGFIGTPWSPWIRCLQVRSSRSDESCGGGTRFAPGARELDTPGSNPDADERWS